MLRIRHAKVNILLILFTTPFYSHVLKCASLGHLNLFNCTCNRYVYHVTWTLMNILC